MQITMKEIRLRVALVIVPLLVAGCTTARQSFPAQTATEQLLISTAVDRAAAKMVARFPPNNRVFVDSQYLDGTDAKYAISAIRDQLAKDGAHLTDDRKSANVVVEVRSGAASIDQKSTLVGIPSFNVPVPFGGTGFKFPQIAFYDKNSEIGTSKLAMTGYDRKDGAYMFTIGPDYGYADQTQWTMLVFLSWTTNNIYQGTP